MRIQGNNQVIKRIKTGDSINFSTIPRAKGAAMVEAVIIIPFLLMMLMLTYQVYKMSIISTNAAVAGRAEMMMYAYSENFSKSGSWNPDHNEHGNRFIEHGLFPDVLSVNIKRGDAEGGAFGAFQSFVAIATGTERITIVAKMPIMPFLSDNPQENTFSCGYTGTCAVESWNWDENIFGKLAQWFTKTGDVDDTSTLDNDIDKN